MSGSVSENIALHSISIIYDLINIHKVIFKYAVGCCISSFCNMCLQHPNM